MLSCEAAGITPNFIFVASGNCSDNSLELLKAFKNSEILLYDDRQAELQILPDGTRELRRWDSGRVELMVRLRNFLLCSVRSVAPDAFLSLDSDILIHPDLVKNLLQSLENYDAVGGRCYMYHMGTREPSYGSLDSRDFVRGEDLGFVCDAGVLMAIKMMTCPAYGVDYDFHHLGEDIGWSLSCRQKGLRLGWDGRIINKHLLYPDMLDRIDDRVGF